MRMRMLPIVGAAAAMVFLSGCCDTACGPVWQEKSGPPLLNEAACPTPPPAKPLARAFRCPPPPTLGDKGIESRDLVYDLGCGTVANSNAVTMPGGLSRPVAKYRQGGALAGCPPPSESERNFQARKPAQAKPAKTQPAAPSASAVPAAPIAAAPGEVVGTDGRELQMVMNPQASALYAACPAPVTDPALCASGDFLSECFTLSEEEARGGPPIYTPGKTTKYEAATVVNSPSSPAAAAAPAVGEWVAFRPANPLEPPVNLTRPSVTNGAPSLPASLAAPAAPADTETIPTASPAPAIQPPADRKQPENGATLQAPVSLPPAEASQAPIAPPAAPGSVSKSEPLPPVPQVSDLEKVAEELQQSSPTDTSSLPEVQLPPRLN